MKHVIGLGLAAGQGVRFQPLSLKAKGYLRAKAAVRLLGRRVLDWIVGILQQQGIEEYIMVTKGKENRYQIKSIVGYGDSLGVRIRYSHVRFDNENTGSADATLTNLDYFEMQDTAFVFPTDSVLDIDLPAMLEQHRRTNAVVTIAAAEQPAESIANRYGLIDRAENSRVLGFIEKPSLEQIHTHYGINGQTRAETSAAGDQCRVLSDGFVALREIGHQPEVIAMRNKQFDIGGDLLPWLVKSGYPVYCYQDGAHGRSGQHPQLPGDDDRCAARALPVDDGDDAARVPGQRLCAASMPNHWR